MALVPNPYRRFVSYPYRPRPLPCRIINMVVCRELLRHWLGFPSRSLSKHLRRVLTGAALCLLLSSVRLATTQSGDSSLETDNEFDNSSCPLNQTCTELSADCITCNFSTSCQYGRETNVTCQPLVDCEGEQEFTRQFNCSFCYQVADDDQCCEPNDECRVRGTPSSTYVAECRVLEDVLCIPPRRFQRMKRCNFSNGKRWTTAFLLSITLGGFGVDRFYLEHWGSAVGKLVSFGGLGVWSILDVILVGVGFLGPADGSAYIY